MPLHADITQEGTIYLGSMGQIPRRANVLNITNSVPCEVTTDGDHGFETYSFVRLTDLNGAMPIPRGVDPLNNYRFRIIVTAADKFILQNPITFQPIDSTNYPPYVTGGFCNLIETEFYYYPNEVEE